MFKQAIVAACAATILFAASAAEAKPAHHARATTRSEQAQIDQAAASMQRWMAELVAWSKPDSDLMLATERELIEITGAGARASRFAEHADHAADIAWATQWTATHKAAYAALLAQARERAKTAGSPPQAPAILLASSASRASRLKSVLQGQHDITIAAVERYAPVADDMFVLINRAAQGDRQASEALRSRLVQMNVGLLETENATLETTIVFSADGNRAVAELSTAQKEGNLGLMEAYRFILAKEGGAAVDKAAFAASIREHARLADDAADRARIEAHALLEHIRAQPGFATTPLFHILDTMTSTFDESAEVEHGISDFHRKLADAVEHSEGDPFLVLLAEKGVTALVERRVALALKRGSIAGGR